jgi:hypothetical protein
MVANETLAYFMVRIMKFLSMVGVDPSRLRFRQVFRYLMGGLFVSTQLGMGSRSSLNHL